MSTTVSNTQESWKRIFLDPPSFDATQSYKTLYALAAQPLDLTEEGVLTTARVEAYRASGAGLSLVYACERVNDQTMKVLFELAKERNVHEQMQSMQQGDIVNFIAGFESERRQVLHTATRDLFGDGMDTIAAKQAQEASKKEHEKLKRFLETIEGRFTDMLFVGIGGSELGPRALYQSLTFMAKRGKKAHFIGNVDPDDVAQTLDTVDLKKSLVVVISKSGTTLETETNEQFLRQAFEKKGLSSKDHFVSVTMPSTPMDDSTKYLECLYLFDYVGGRYSSTSMVGGVLLGFMYGYDVFLELCRGAHAMDKIALSKDYRSNLPLLGALIGVWNRNFLHYQTHAVIPYSRQLARFPAHLQQCDMESNGKRIDRHGRVVKFATGPIIWGEPGTNAQHSFFQLLYQGTSIVSLDLIGFKEAQGNTDFEYKGTTSQEKLLSNLFAQAIALAKGQKHDNPNKCFPGNRPSSLLIAKKLTPFTLGTLLAYYEHKIAFQGFLWGINSFDQEGVQLGKMLATKTLSLYASRRQQTTFQAFDLGQAFIDLCDAL